MSVKTIGIHGIGGVGKSWLAACVYRDWKAEKFWADVSQYPEFGVFAEQILQSFDGSIYANFVQSDLTEQVNQLLDCLGKQRRLLVIDNLETLLDQLMQWRDPAYWQFFSRWREQGHTSVLLVTTQDKPTSLLEEPTWLNLTGLAPTEGSKLLKELGIQGPEEALQEFSIQLDGHPLSLRLAATFLREYCNGSLDQAEKLRLTEFEQIATQAEGEHRSRLTRLEWILQRHLECLTNEQHTFLENLSVYRLPFDESAAMAMLSPEVPSSPLETLKELRRLFNHSLLLQSEDNCYQLQPSIKKYVQCFADDLSTAHQRAIVHYQQQIARVLPEINDKVTADLEIFYHCCELSQFEQAYKALNYRHEYLYQWGHYTILINTHQQLVQNWQSVNQDDQYHIGWTWLRLGHAYRLTGASKQAVEAYQQAKKLFSEVVNWQESSGSASDALAASLDALGGIYHLLGQHQQSLESYQQALKLTQQTSNYSLSCQILLNAGNVYCTLTNYPKAVEFYSQALEAARHASDYREEIDALQKLGLVCCSLYQYPQAVQLLREALNIARHREDRQSVANALSSLGFVYTSKGRYKRAIKLYEHCLYIMQNLGNHRGEAKTLKEIGRAYKSLRDHTQAIQFLEKALNIATQIGDRQSEAYILGDLAEVSFHEKNHQQSAKFYQETIVIAELIGDQRGEANARVNLGFVLEKLGQLTAAKTNYQQARELYIAMGLTAKVQACEDLLQRLETGSS